MNEHIHSFDEKNLYEQYLNILMKSISSKYISYKNNNDTFNILLSSFLRFKSFILSIYKCFLSYISSLNKIIYQIEFILLILVLLFSFVITFEDNSEIPTNLILSAYFPKYPKVTSISYENIKSEPIENENKDIEEINFDDFNKLIKNKINNKDNLIECNGNKIHFNDKDFICTNNIDNNLKLKVKEQILGEIKTKVKTHMKHNQRIYPPNLTNNKKNEVYLYYDSNLIKFILINILSLLFLYLFIKYTLYSGIRCSFLFNFFFLFLSFNLLNSLYKKEIYFASNCFFILFIYINKNLIDSVYLKLKYKRKDFEIFSTSLIAFDYKQFHLKIILLLNVTILSGIFSIFLFKSFLNYIVFYICLFTLLVFLSNTIEPVMPYYLKPVKNIVIFCCGIINFLFSKIIIRYLIDRITDILKYKYSYYFQKYLRYYDLHLKNDSLYFISDLFSLFCFNYIKKYLEFQIEINLIIDNLTDKNNNSHDITKYKMSKLAINQFSIWILFLWISMVIGIIGIFKKEFMCLIMSICLIKLLMNYFCNIYDKKLSLILYYLHSFMFLLINLDISNFENTYLINLFSNFTNIDNEILSFMLKFFTLLFIIYYIVLVNLIIYNSSKDKFKSDKDSKKIKKNNKDSISNSNVIEVENLSINNFKIISNLIYIIFDCFCNYFIICLLIKIYHYYEKSLIFKILYCFLMMIFHFMKIFIIHKIKNKNEYYLYYLIWLFFSLRLITLTNNNLYVSFFINHLNLLLFLIFYFLSDKQNYLFTIFISLILVIAYYKLNSFMFIIDIIIIFCILFLINFVNLNDENEKSTNNEEKKDNDDFGNMNIYNGLSLLFLLPILVFFIIQLKFQNFFNILNIIDKYIKDLMVKMYILSDEENENNNYVYKEPFEFFIIDEIIYGMKLVGGNF